MNAEVHCSHELLLQADFDGELDAAQSATLESHLRNCALCMESLSRLQRSRALLVGAQRFAAPTALHAKIQERLRVNARKENVSAGSSVAQKFRYLISGAGVGALAAGLLAFLLLANPHTQMAESIVDNHVRAMQSPEHLLDVISTEHHTVKPWFAGRIDFAPPVKDMEAFGYRLRGARVDVSDGRNIAVTVYQAGKHSIDLSIAPRKGVGISVPNELRGFNIRHWVDADFDIWAVSDLNSRELDAFVERWKGAR